MLTTQQIQEFIEKDKISNKKRLAKVGANYYEGKHDIRNYKLFYYNDDGQLKEEKDKSNIKISHPFFTEQVDQKVQYLFSGDGYLVNSDDPELQNLLDEYINENDDFKAELEEVSTEASTKGYGYLFMYRGKDGKLQFQCADTMGVVEVRAKDTQDNCDYVIYWYVDRITEENEIIKKIQVWNNDSVSFYVQKNSEEIELDESVNPNPRTHSIYEENNKLYGTSFNMIPFFRIDNNRKQLSDLTPIKDLIDDYDLMSCGLSNNIQDASEYLVVVKGFEGGSMEELDRNIRTKKRIGVGEGGDIDFKTIEIPYQARQTKLDLDEKNIYRFGMAFNSAQLGDGNITNVVIKSRYALLDLKCNKFETQLRKLLRQIMKVILKEINDEYKTDYQLKDIRFNFEREVMTNALDNEQIELAKAQTEQTRITTLLNLASSLDQETIIQKVCDILDIDYQKIKEKLPVDESDTTEYEGAINNLGVE